MTEPPNIHWRDIVRGGMSRFPREGTGAEFLAFVQEHHTREKQAAALSPPEGANVALFTLGAALLTFGRLDAVDDILGNIPPIRHPARVLVRCIDALIPLPSGLDPLLAPHEAAAWINTNRTRLRWSDEAGKFGYVP